MATSISEISGFLKETGYRFEQFGENQIRLGFTTQNYINPLGHKSLLLLISLFEDGRYLAVSAPLAMKLAGPHADAFVRACMMFQWQTKLIQFEYDDSDGEIRPVIEFPLEDAPLTRTQLNRCLHGMVTLVDEVYPILKKALETGVIEFPKRGGAAANPIRDMLLAKIAELERAGAPEAQIAPLRALLAMLPGGGTPPPTAI